MAAYKFHLLKGREFFFLEPAASRNLEAKDVELPWNFYGDVAQSTGNSELTTFLFERPEPGACVWRRN